MIRRIIAIIIGVAMAIFMVYFIELIGHETYPKHRLNFNLSKYQLSQQIKAMPIMPLLIPAFAWGIAAFLGGFWARAIDKNLSLPFAILPGILVTVGAVMVITSVPYPFWFILVGLFLALAGTYFGQEMGKKVKLF